MKFTASEKGDITFVDVAKYFDKALSSAASVILINEKMTPPPGKGLIFCEDPFSAFNQINRHFHQRLSLDHSGTPAESNDQKIGNNVAFGESVEIGKGVEIGHNAVIGSHVRIGDGTRIHANVTIYDHTSIGKNCIIHAGTVIGSDAFYYKKREWGRERMESVGSVEIGDHVEIGSNCTIDRGVTAVTRIGDHTKIDNLVQIGHDTLIGKRCLFASQVGIAGCVSIGNDVVIWGQAGLISDVYIEDGVTILAKTGVMDRLETGKVYGGMIADNAKNFLRKEAALKKLIKILPQLESLLKDPD